MVLSFSLSRTQMEGGLKLHAQLVVGISAMCLKVKASVHQRMNVIASIAFHSSLLLQILQVEGL